MTDLAGLAQFKELGAVGLSLLLLALLLLRFVTRWANSNAKTTESWANFLQNRDKQANELHLETIRSISAHTAKMASSESAIIDQVKASAESVKAHVTERTARLKPNESSTNTP